MATADMGDTPASRALLLASLDAFALPGAPTGGMPTTSVMPGTSAGRARSKRAAPKGGCESEGTAAKKPKRAAAVIAREGKSQFVAAGQASRDGESGPAQNAQCIVCQVTVIESASATMGEFVAPSVAIEYVSTLAMELAGGEAVLVVPGGVERAHAEMSQCTEAEVATIENASAIMSSFAASSAVGEAVEANGTPAKKSKPKLRQAREAVDKTVEVLCFACRRSKETTVQSSLTGFIKKKAPPDEVIVVDTTSRDAIVDLSICARCRRPMQEKSDAIKLPSERPAFGSNVGGQLPQHTRLKGYQRIAKEQGVPYLLSEQRASAIMRGDCVGCGVAAPPRGHGLTRLRHWPEGLTRPERGGFMGPYVEENVAAACSICNLMKGYQTVRGFVECARHIASMQTPGEDFGTYPQRFRDNVSRRSRSCYISSSSTHTKTHAISNDDFNGIVGQRCFYCHKEPRNPKTLGPKDRGHFNGLDRLDSANRVYTTETAVACCGTCNIMKYRWPLEAFLEHCRAVARFNVGRIFPEEGEDGRICPEPDDEGCMIEDVTAEGMAEVAEGMILLEGQECEENA